MDNDWKPLAVLHHQALSLGIPMRKFFVKAEPYVILQV
jgi:hypothetical protein